jgi:hypothetical protein
MTTLTALLAAALVLFAVPSASAHTQSYGFLTVAANDDSVSGRVELAIRDLDLAYDLDGDGNGSITWGEFRTREPTLVPALLDRISIDSRAGPCPLTGGPTLIDWRGGDAYAVVPFEGSCPSFGGRLGVGYDLLFEHDAQHRALAAITFAGRTHSVVMAAAANRVLLDGSDEGAGLFFTFVAHGAHHIWVGYDHILFLITLLLGAVVTRQAGRWMPVDKLSAALFAVVKVVTSFTVAHSLTLGLAAFGVLRLPPVLTESVIAATIILAALNNIIPVVTRRIWLLALVFGLIHGVGFANVLADLDLPSDGLLTALLAFNLGVEFGQLVIVFAVLPLIVLIGRRPIYGRVALPVVSLAVALLGAMWLLDRTVGLAIVSSG